MKIKTLLLTLLISISLIGTSQALTFSNSSNNNNNNNSSKSTQSAKVDVAKSGISIENDPNLDFFKPPIKPYPTDILYWFGRMWQMADFNKDGYSDVLYIGTMNPDNVKETGEDTGGICGGGKCKGKKPLPSLYLGDANKQLTYSPELLIDKREDIGMSLGRQLLVADYNNDGILDFYVADHGIGTHKGVRDSYFLSQPNGTWLESSETHLSHSNFVVFDHGGATGDIDNDGDMDVVITDLQWKKRTPFWCLINDGTGYLKKRKCGGSNAFGLELADMDNDGDLDALVGGHEFSNTFTGIAWNDGKGNFNKYNKTRLPQYKKKWGVIAEVSAADLDNDGDLDIVYGRAGELYVGTAIQIIENLGKKKFKDHGIFPLVEAPDDYIATHEGNEWNDFIEMIKFRDLDKDGDNDIYLSSGSKKTNGAVVINNGNFDFSLIKPSKADELYKKLAEASTNEATFAKTETELALEAIETSDAFDGRYSFNILREASFGVSKSIGNGYIEINNGIMTVAKDGRTINVDSEDLYDSFKGRIDKKGNISARLTMYPMCGAFRLQNLEFSGNINGQLKTDCGDGSHDIYTLLELNKEQ